MANEHHDVIVENKSSGFGALALVLSVIVLLVVLWLAFGGDASTGETSETGDNTVPTTEVTPTE